MTAVLLPDVEQIVSDYLRNERTELAALIPDVDSGARIYGELPKRDRTYPLVRVSRIGGGAISTPRFLDRALLSFEVWGGTKSEARTIAETISACLDQITGFSAFGGYATGSAPGSLRYIRDDSFEPAKPRYVLDAVVLIRPTP